MKGYKAFKKGMVCIDKQYAENTVFEEKTANLCEAGMHFCENPMDVLNYYPLVDADCNITEFAEVESLGKLKRDETKCCTNKLRIGKKLSLGDWIKSVVSFVMDKTKEDDSAQLASSGDSAQLASSGNCAQLASSGYFSNLASSGDSTQLASSGDCAKLASSGDCAQFASSGDFAKLASSGYFSKLASSGYSSKLASSGDSTQLASSGDYAKLASSGDCAKLASSGDCAQLASSGDYAKLASSGDCAVIAGIGVDNKAKAKTGSFIVLAEYKYNSETNRAEPVDVEVVKVDGEKIKADTWYKLENGEFVETGAVS